MPDKIQKFTEDRDEWSVEDFVTYARSGQLPISEEYKKARNKALTDAGLEPDQDVEDVPPEDQTVAEIAKGMESTKSKRTD